MVPRLIPEISSLDAFCDGAAGAGAAAAGIGDSRSWMIKWIDMFNSIHRVAVNKRVASKMYQCQVKRETDTESLLHVLKYLLSSTFL